MRVLGLHVGGDRLAGNLYDRLQIRRQRFPGRPVHVGLQCGRRLLPAGVVVIPGDGVQPQRDVVVRADPLGGIDGAGLQGGEDLRSGQRDGGAASPPQHFAAETRDAHLEALEIGDRIDLLVEPAAHLHAGIAAGERHQVERLVELAPEIEPAAVVEPRVHLHVGHAKRQRGHELRRGHFALVVIRRVVTHFDGAAAGRIEGLERRYQFASGVHLDLEAPPRRPVDTIDEVVDGDAQPRVLRRPRSRDGPLELLLESRCRRCVAAVLPGTGGQPGRREAAHELSSFHRSLRAGGQNSR